MKHPGLLKYKALKKLVNSAIKLLSLCQAFCNKSCRLDKNHYQIEFNCCYITIQNKMH